MTRADLKLARYMLGRRPRPSFATVAQTFGVSAPVLQHCLELADEYDRDLAAPAH